MLHRNRAIGAMIVLAAGLLARAESGPPRIETLGRFFPSDLYSDGMVVVGSVAGTNGTEIIRWEAGMGPAELLGKYTEHTWAYGVSGDGSVIVGVDYNTAGVRWMRQTGLEHFGGGHAMDASFDGSVIIGKGYRWTRQGGFTPLTLDPVIDPFPRKVSDDGTVIVGSAHNGTRDFAFRWTADSGIVFLPNLPNGGTPHPATALTPDGSVIVGTALLDADPVAGVAFRWTPETGTQPLPHLPNYNPQLTGAIATAVTPDGRAVFGHEAVISTTGLGQEAFVWDTANGTRPLKHVLETEYGIDLTGWQLESIEALSSDGTTLIGIGSHPDYGNHTAFRIIIPEPTSILWLSAAFVLLVRRH